MDVLIVIGFVALVAAFLLFAVGIFVTRLYRKVEQGSAMVVNKTRTIDVTFSGALVMPVIHKAELMDISVRRLQIARQGKEGLICKRQHPGRHRRQLLRPGQHTTDDVDARGGAARSAAPSASNQATMRRAVRGQVLRGAQDRRQADGLRRALRAARRLPSPGHRGHRRGPQRLRPRRRRHRVPRADPAIGRSTRTTSSTPTASGRSPTSRPRKRSRPTSSTARPRSRSSPRTSRRTQAVFEMDRQEKAAEYRAQREIATTKAREESVSRQVEAEERLKAEQARLAHRRADPGPEREPPARGRGRGQEPRAGRRRRDREAREGPPARGHRPARSRPPPPPATSRPSAPRSPSWPRSGCRPTRPSPSRRRPSRPCAVVEDANREQGVGGHHRRRRRRGRPHPDHQDRRGGREGRRARRPRAARAGRGRPRGRRPRGRGA